MAASTSQTSTRPKPKESNPVVLAYLIAYNVAQVMGWSAIFLAMLGHLTTEKDYRGLYQKSASLLNIFQTAALLEIVHCAIGIVKSNVVLTAFQVFSRVLLTWGVVYSVPMVQEVYGVGMFMFAWTVTEMIRYAYYVFALIGEVPYGLQWCRYTFFIFLYPIGVTGELLTILNSLDFVQRAKLYTIELPNMANMSFSYYYFLIIACVSYIPIFPQLYMHMLAQRKKVLGTKTKTE